MADARLTKVEEFHAAVEDGNLEAARKMLTADPALATEAFDDCTPVRLAIYGEQPEVLELLLQRGASANEADDQGETPLHVAAGLGEYPLVSLLLKHGADASRRDDEGYTALFRATEYGGNSEIAELLASHGAPMDLSSAVVMGRSGWVREQLTIGHGDGELRDHLLSRVVETLAEEVPESIDTERERYRLADALRTWQPVLELLLEQGADPNAVSVLEPALRVPDAAVLRLLLERGLDPNEAAEGWEDVVDHLIRQSPQQAEFRSLLKQHGYRGRRSRYLRELRENYSLRFWIAGGGFLSIAWNILAAPVAANGFVEVFSYCVAGFALALTVGCVVAQPFLRKQYFAAFLAFGVSYVAYLAMTGMDALLILVISASYTCVLAAVLHADWVNNGRFPSREERSADSGNVLLRAFGPRSLPAAMYCMGCLLFATALLTFPGAVWPPDALTLVLFVIGSLPLILLGITFWFHSILLRFLGPLVCLAWLAMMLFGGLWIVAIFLLIIGWNLARWNWENPAWMRRAIF